MKRRKLTEVLIETVETIVIRRKPTSAAGQLTAWCALCNAATIWFTPDTAAQLTDTTTRTIYHQVETGQLHFLETKDGKLWLCSNALRLSAQADQSPEQPAITKEN